MGNRQQVYKRYRLSQDKQRSNLVKISMQQENFPNISTSKDFKPSSQQHLLQVLAYLKFIHEKHLENNKKTKTEHKKQVIDEKTFKKLESLTKQSSKIAIKCPQQLMLILKELIGFFIDVPHPNIITLITNLLGPDMKFQAIKIAQQISAQRPHRVDDSPAIALPMVEQSIIALPDSSYCTTIARHQASDVGIQQNRHAHQQYLIQDDAKVVQYLENPFKTVNRPGISQLFQRAVHFILTEFIEKLIQQKHILELHVDNVTAILKLLEYISAPLYTYYFLSLVRQLTQLILNCFSVGPQAKLLESSTLSQDICHKIKRTQYQELIYAVRTLTERWNDRKSEFNIQLWEWQMEQNMILRFLQSPTSQKQLYSVKTIIDRCRKVQYNSYSILSQEQLIVFIQANHVLQHIYNAQNHPQVIIKGKELFEFISKNTALTHYLIDIVFELIPKSNQNICKALYSTLQATGHTNLQNNRQYIMTKISLLPRSNLFFNETFTLIESLILLAPIQLIGQSLKYVYQIIYCHYFGLKPQLKHKILNIYFQVYLMGVQQGEFDTNQDKIMIVLEPFLQDQAHIFSRLTFLIIDKFLEKLKEHLPKKIGPKCKNILTYCIQILFKKYKIHQRSLHYHKSQEINSNKSLGQSEINKYREFRQCQLGLVKQLLQSSQKQLTKGFLSQKQLWQLIEYDSYFGRFLSYYSTESQLYLLEKLISKVQIREKDIKNIIESYYFMDKDVKEKIFIKIYDLFYSSKDPSIKEKLVEFVVRVSNSSAQEIAHKVISQITKPQEQLSFPKILSVLMQLKESLGQHDKQGCGSYPAFKYLTSDYSLKLKILNMVDMFNPQNFELEEKNYRTLYDVVKRLLPILGKSLKQIKLKIDKNEKYVTLQQLKQKLNSLSPYRQISLTIQQSTQCQWYDQSLLITKTKQLNLQIVQILKQIFNHYCQQVNGQKRLFKQGACRIFQRATDVQTISVNDMRMLHLFNNYSQTGEYLTIHEWVNFYYQSALVNPFLVISNLKNLGYAHVFQTANQMIENFTLESQNRFRQYFAFNQQIYNSVFDLFRKISQNHQQECEVLINKISSLSLEILKELPKWQQLQKQILDYFIHHDHESNNQGQNVDRIVEEKQQPNISIVELIQSDLSIVESKQKVYFTGMILSHQLDQIQLDYPMHHNAQNSSSNNNNNNDKLMQLETPLDFTKTITKVQNYGIQIIKKIFNQLLLLNDRQQQPSTIDPLNLTYDQNINITVLQSIGSLITRPLFREMNRIKNTLKLQVHQMVPLSLQNLTLIKLNSLQRHNSCQQGLWNKLQQLSAINSDLVVDYVGVLMYELVERQQLSVIEQILSTFVLNNKLLFSKQLQLSRVCNHLVYLLSDSIQGLTHWYIIQLLSSIKYILFKQQNSHISTVEYFNTLHQLLLIQTNPQLLLELSHIIYSILDKATNQHSYADFFQNKHHSQTLQGLLLSLKTLLNTSQTNKFTLDNKLSNLCETLLTNFVLSQKSQSHLYQILSKVNSPNPIHNLNFAYKKFTQLQLKKNSKLNTDNLNQCGIYNLGCICYINSVFQQLYHIDVFSNYIINTQLKQVQVRDKEVEPYFGQFQKIIYNLKYSKRAFLITNKFCQNYTDYTGMPINTKEQHDADQFLNNLLDKLQKTYQNTYHLPKQHTIVNQQFKGSMSNVITCQNCFTHKPNREEFYVLSLQIKNQTSLQECLDKMVEPQVICDYYCNNCDKKVDQIHKFRKFNSLPNILFIHFQRLVFDLQTFTKIKLDHPVNFAQEIDLQNYFYSQQSRPCNYRLLGFIVHFGNSQGGHYISLIKGSENNSWKKYDDSRVTKWFWKTGVHQKDNAYLLIYEKVQDPQHEQTIIDLQINHSMNEDQNTKQGVLKGENNTMINQKILQEITQDNILLGKQITVIRPDFGKFLISQLQKCQTSQNSMLKQQNDDFENDLLKTKLIWKYFRIIDQAKTVGFSQGLPLKDNELQYLAMKFIESNRSPETAQHFLDIAVEVQLTKSIYQSGQKKLRQIFLALLANIVSMWNGYFSQSSYMVPVKQNETIRKLMMQVQNGLSQVGKNYSKMDEYFEFILVLIRLVSRAKQYLKQMNIVAKLVHFIMHKDSKLSQKLGLYPNNSPISKKVPCYNTIIQIIALYIEQYPQLVTNELISISLGSRGFEFYKKMYEDRYENYIRVNTIVTRFCYDNFELSNKVIDELILNKINRFSHEDFYIMAYLDLIYCILSIKDEHRLHRMYRVLGVPTLLIDTSSEQDVMIRKRKQRIVAYWSNYITAGDQIIMPFLQQLYNNKDNLNYFQLTGIVYLLQLIKENEQVTSYIMKLPSPCFVYENYLSWISDFIRNSLRLVTHNNKHLEKIDVKTTLNRISLLLEEIEPQVGQMNQYKDHLEEDIANEKMQELYCEQAKQYMSIQNLQNSQLSHYINPNEWKQRNQSFLFGQIVQKSQTRLLNQQVYQNCQQPSKTSHKQLFSIPITYCLLKTLHIKDILPFAYTVLTIEDIIQPNEGFTNQLSKKHKINQLLQNHLSPSQLDNSILQISFSGQNQQLAPYKCKEYALKVKFLHEAYRYELLISVDKLISDQCKVIVPSCTRNIPDYLAQDWSLVDGQVSRCMEVTLVPLINTHKSHNNSDQMQQSQGMKPDTTASNRNDNNSNNNNNHNSNGNSSNNYNNLATIEQEYPSMDQVYGSDAYMQQAEQPFKTQQVPKEQVCIECPFCGYIAHEFASRCPGCNEQWGYFA